MAELSGSQLPPRLPSDPRPDITNVLSEINQSKLQPEKENQDKVKQETEQGFGMLPPELQVYLRSFYRDVAATIVSQSTNINGDKVELRVTPARAEYYKGRLNQVLESQFLNPHMNPQKKITE